MHEAEVRGWTFISLLMTFTSITRILMAFLVHCGWRSCSAKMKTVRLQDILIIHGVFLDFYIQYGLKQILFSQNVLFIQDAIREDPNVRYRQPRVLVSPVYTSCTIATIWVMFLMSPNCNLGLMDETPLKIASLRQRNLFQYFKTRHELWNPECQDTRAWMVYAARSVDDGTDSSNALIVNFQVQPPR